MNLEESQKKNEDIDEMKARIFRGLLLDDRFEDLCKAFDDIKEQNWIFLSEGFGNSDRN